MCSSEHFRDKWTNTGYPGRIRLPLNVGNDFSHCQEQKGSDGHSYVVILALAIPSLSATSYDGWSLVISINFTRDQVVGGSGGMAMTLTLPL